jgi:hypothetical protein
MIRSSLITLAVAASVSSALAGSTGPLSLSKAPADVLAAAKMANGTDCDFSSTSEQEDRYSAEDFTWKGKFDNPDDPINKATLHVLACVTFGDSTQTTYVLTREGFGTEPIRLVFPEYQGVYAKNSDGFDDTANGLDHINLIGLKSVTSLQNGHFDHGALTISNNYGKEASGNSAINGVWKFVEGEFLLTHYDIDASDDEIVDPTMTFDADAPSP